MNAKERALFTRVVVMTTFSSLALVVGVILGKVILVVLGIGGLVLARLDLAEVKA